MMVFTLTSAQHDKLSLNVDGSCLFADIKDDIKYLRLRCEYACMSAFFNALL